MDYQKSLNSKQVNSRGAINAPVYTLKKLSNTRWCCQVSAVKIFIATLSSIIATLKEVAENHPGDRALKARGLLTQIDFHFILSLWVHEAILGTTKGLSDLLQSTDMDLCSAMELVTATEENLVALKDDDKWADIVMKAQNDCRVHSIALQNSRQMRQRLLPQYLEDYEVDSIISDMNRAFEYNKFSTDAFKQNVYIPTIQLIISQFSHRFSQTNKDILNAIGCFSPKSKTFMDFQNIKKTCRFLLSRHHIS
jgi:hypothetical protein